MNTKLTLEARTLVIEVLVQSETPLNAMETKRLVEAVLEDSHNDWHEYLNYLESLAQEGFLEYAGVDSTGHQKYAARRIA